MKETTKRVIPTLKNMKQVYDNYTDEDHKVWSVLYNRQIDNVKQHATHPYISGHDLVGFDSEYIPNFDEVNQRLDILTGWELVAVEGIVDDQLFFQLLSEKKFPATTWLRKMDELDYLEEPDMFHDVFGHVPLLTNQRFVDFLQFISKVALEYADNEWMVHLISRIYWFTVEFGLMKEGGEYKIYGAGILSSVGETAYSISDKPAHHQYNVSKILNSSYRKDIFQEEYFVIKSFDDLYLSIRQIEEELKKVEKVSIL